MSEQPERGLHIVDGPRPKDAVLNGNGRRNAPGQVKWRSVRCDKITGQERRTINKKEAEDLINKFEQPEETGDVAPRLLYEDKYEDKQAKKFYLATIDQVIKHVGDIKPHGGGKKESGLRPAQHESVTLKKRKPTPMTTTTPTATKSLRVERDRVGVIGSHTWESEASLTKCNTFRQVLDQFHFWIHEKEQIENSTEYPEFRPPSHDFRKTLDGFRTMPFADRLINQDTPLIKDLVSVIWTMWSELQASNGGAATTASSSNFASRDDDMDGDVPGPDNYGSSPPSPPASGSDESSNGHSNASSSWWPGGDRSNGFSNAEWTCQGKNDLISDQSSSHSDRSDSSVTGCDSSTSDSYTKVEFKDCQSDTSSGDGGDDAGKWPIVTNSTPQSVVQSHDTAKMGPIDIAQEEEVEKVASLSPTPHPSSGDNIDSVDHSLSLMTNRLSTLRVGEKAVHGSSDAKPPALGNKLDHDTVGNKLDHETTPPPQPQQQPTAPAVGSRCGTNQPEASSTKVVESSGVARLLPEEDATVAQDPQQDRKQLIEAFRESSSECEPMLVKVEIVLSHMRDAIENEEVQVSCLEKIRELCKGDGYADLFVSCNATDDVVQAMMSFPQAMMIQEKGCFVLWRFFRGKGTIDKVMLAGTCEQVHKSLCMVVKGEERLSRYAIGALCAFSTRQEGRKILNDLNVSVTAAQVMRQCMTSEFIQRTGMILLSNCLKNKDPKSMASSSSSEEINAVVHAMVTYQSSSALIKAGCATLKKYLEKSMTMSRSILVQDKNFNALVLVLKESDGALDDAQWILENIRMAWMASTDEDVSRPTPCHTTIQKPSVHSSTTSREKKDRCRQQHSKKLQSNPTSTSKEGLKVQGVEYRIAPAMTEIDVITPEE